MSAPRAETNSTESNERARAGITGGRPLVLCSAIAAVGIVVLTACWAEQWNVITITLLVAMSWAAVVSAVDAYIAWGHADPAADAVAGGDASVTFVMRLGQERIDLARTSLALATQAGPVVVVATSHHELLDELAALDIREFVAPTFGEAVRDAANVITSDAVHLISASAFPLGDASVRASAQLTDGVGWVVGSAPAFNNDRYAPDEREALGADMRRDARDLGLVTWEPDATIVRTALLQEHPLVGGRPDGAWLRDRAAEGWRGEVRPEPVAVRAAPADAPVFWPTQTKRRRGVVADLADAATRGPVGARFAALGSLLRELYAFPIALWLLAIVAIARSNSFPLAIPATSFFALSVGLTVIRWATSRLAYGVGLHPVDEARAAAYDAPGSLLALSSAVTRRVRPVRFEIPDQPLLWVALVVTLFTTIPLLDRRPTGHETVGVAVGLALVALAVTWVFALRAFGARGWDRASYRLPLDVPATLDGRPMRTVDASPSGIAVAGAAAPVSRGATVALSVDVSPTRTVALHGRVTDVRTSHDGTEVGIALELSPDERIAWVRDLFGAEAQPGAETVALIHRPKRARVRSSFSQERPTFRHRLLVAFQVIAVGGMSVLVLGALLMAFLGYRPMVVRSGSMVPTLGIGDVVVNDWVRIGDVRPGQIITFPTDIVKTGLVTHRVQQIRTVGDTAEVVTKGDANPDSEHWTLPAGTLVGHVDWRIPYIGRLLVLLGQTSTRWFLLGLTAVLVLVAVLVSSARRRRTFGIAVAS